MSTQPPWLNHEWPDLPRPSKQQFLAARRRRFGRSNPEPVDELFLTYMVKTRCEPYWLREVYDWGEDTCQVGEKLDLWTRTWRHLA